VGEDEDRRVSMDEGSPGSREVEGEGGEDLYIARSGKRADLLVSLGGQRGPTRVFR
jgi:hypothetical protein